MKALEFAHELNCRLLKFRFVLNRSAQCMNLHDNAIQITLANLRKSQAKLQASTERMERCFMANGVRL